MTELAIVLGLNALCFWKRPVYVLVPVAMLDVIFGLIWAPQRIRRRSTIQRPSGRGEMIKPRRSVQGFIIRSNPS